MASRSAPPQGESRTKPIQIAAAALVGSAYATMVLGAYVKAIGAGMACSEWPTCNDSQLLPGLDNAGVAAELLHRVAASTVMLSGVALLFFELSRYRAERRLILLTLAAAATLAVQVALGAITISSNLLPIVVTAHQAVAILFFGLSLVIALNVWRLPRAPAAATAGAASEASRAPTDADASRST